MTSNIGTTHHIPGKIAFTPDRSPKEERQARSHEHLQERVMPALKQLFTPELLDRVDEIVCFQTLEREQLSHVADLLIEQTQQRPAAQSITPQVKRQARNPI